LNDFVLNCTLKSPNSNIEFTLISCSSHSAGTSSKQQGRPKSKFSCIRNLIKTAESVCHLASVKGYFFSRMARWLFHAQLTIWHKVFYPHTGNGRRVIYPQAGFCQISPSYERNVTVVIVTLSLNKLGIRRQVTESFVYYWFFATGL